MVDLLKYARIEEERRFLLKIVPTGLDSGERYVRIFDLYMPGTRLRLRRMESPAGEAMAYKLGQKYQAEEQDSRRTVMTNIYLIEAEYSLLARLGGATLIKRRYHYRDGANEYGIDVFEGELSGLVLAEIERRPGQEIASLPVPGFAVREVTGEPRFTGGELAKLTRREFLHWTEKW